MTLRSVALVGDERNGDEHEHGAHEQIGGEFILDLGAAVEFDLVRLLAEHKEDYQRADHGARLNYPEHTGSAVVNKEVGEVEICRLCEEYRGRVAHERCGALEV